MIKRKSTTIIGTVKYDLSYIKKGERVVLTKDDQGWHGGGYFWPVGIIREVVEIEEQY